MSTVTETADGPAGRSTGRVVVAAVLAVIAILFIIAAILYFSEPAKSLPSVLGTLKHPPKSLKQANEHRSVRGIGAIVVGVIFLAGAWFALSWKRGNR